MVKRWRVLSTSTIKPIGAKHSEDKDKPYINLGSIVPVVLLLWKSVGRIDFMYAVVGKNKLTISVAEWYDMDWYNKSHFVDHSEKHEFEYGHRVERIIYESREIRCTPKNLLTLTVRRGCLSLRAFYVRRVLYMRRQRFMMGSRKE